MDPLSAALENEILRAENWLELLRSFKAKRDSFVELAGLTVNDLRIAVEELPGDPPIQIPVSVAGELPAEPKQKTTPVVEKTEVPADTSLCHAPEPCECDECVPPAAPTESPPFTPDAELKAQVLALITEQPRRAGAIANRLIAERHRVDHLLAHMREAGEIERSKTGTWAPVAAAKPVQTTPKVSKPLELATPPLRAKPLDELVLEHLADGEPRSMTTLRKELKLPAPDVTAVLEDLVQRGRLIKKPYRRGHVYRVSALQKLASPNVTPPAPRLSTPVEPLPVDETAVKAEVLAKVREAGPIQPYRLAGMLDVRLPDVTKANVALKDDGSLDYDGVGRVKVAA